jgi:uroporphyrinogen III methyltransferase / synthase
LSENGQPGTVYLVGAGPGDPGLLTLRGAEVLARADVVVHDRLTDASLLALAPAGAERLDVGKQPDDRGDQGAINELLVDRAKRGRRVVRLKGGDPFVFGRGGEEALALLSAGVQFEVVPGVTSAVAAPAYAGVPVTHRGVVTSFTVVAGHSRSVDAAPAEGGTNWEALAEAGGTIVVLMGAGHRGRVAERLMAGGMSPATPVMAVQWGTEPQQTTTRTTLAELAATELAPPVTMVIGEVAALDLSWYPRRPLAAKTVVVTRAAHQAPALSAGLRDLGARVIELPVITLAAPADGGTALAAAAARVAAGGYSWAVFTSANAVEQFFALVPDTRALATTMVAAIGPATAEALRRFRVVADLVPADYRAEGLLAAFPSAPVTPPPALLLPQAAGARPELAAGLAGLGWAVDAVAAYRTLPNHVGAELLGTVAGADAICFASPSALASYFDQAGDTGPRVPPVVACIGPVTAAAARARGLTVSAEAAEHTIDGLLAALAAAMAGAPSSPPG